MIPARPARRRFHTGLLLALCLVAVPVVAAEVPEPPFTLTGKVVGIADGDTITVLVGTTQHKIRVGSIDTPERGQAFGTRATQFTSKLVFGKTVTVRVVKIDRYDRSVGRVTVPTEDGPVDLSAELVRAGLAWWYRKYAPDDEELAKLEAEARAARPRCYTQVMLLNWEF